MSAIWAVALCSTPILLLWAAFYRLQRLARRQPSIPRPSFAPAPIHEHTTGAWHFSAFRSGASFQIRTTYWRPDGSVGQDEFPPEQFALLAMVPVSADVLDQGACLVSLDGCLVVDLVSLGGEMHLRARRPRDPRPVLLMPIAEVGAWCGTAWEFVEECVRRLPGGILA